MQAKAMIAGKSTWYGIVSIFTQMPMSGRLSSTSKRFPTHIETMRPQKSAGSSLITFGPGVMPWMMNAPTMSAMTGCAGQAQREQRDEGRLRRGVVGRLRAGDALDGAVSERLRVLRDALLDRVGGEGARTWPRPAGCRAPSPAPCRAARADDPAEVLAGQPQVLDLLDHDGAGLLVLEVAEDLGDAEHADRDRHEVDAPEQSSRTPNVNRGVPV